MSDFEVNLPVPFKSEWDGDATETANDCGPTSAAMVMSFYGENHTTNEIFELTGAGQGLISISQLVGAIQSFGFKCEYKEGLSEDDLKNYLRQSIVPILLVHYGSLKSVQDTNFKGGHFFVPVGFRNDGWLVNDPNFWGDLRQDGDHHFYTEEEFMGAWGSCHLDENPDYTAIIIYPKTLAINYEKLFNEKRVECDENWDIIQATANELDITLQDPIDKIEVKNNFVATVQALKLQIETLTKKIEQQPVVSPSNSTLEVPISYPGQDSPPTQTNPIPTHGPKKDQMRLSDLIVYLFMRIKTVLKMR